MPLSTNGVLSLALRIRSTMRSAHCSGSLPGRGLRIPTRYVVASLEERTKTQTNPLHISKHETCNLQIEKDDERISTYLRIWSPFSLKSELITLRILSVFSILLDLPLPPTTQIWGANE